MPDIVSLSLDALTLMSILMLVALGLAIIYGLMGIINLSHGEFVTIGAYTLFTVQAAGGSFWLALIVAPVVGYLFGTVLEVTVIHPNARRCMPVAGSGPVGRRPICLSREHHPTACCHGSGHPPACAWPRKC